MQVDPVVSSTGEINTANALSNDRLSFMAMLLDSVSDAVIVFDKNKVITFWNKGAEKVYGWTSKEATGKDSAALLRSEASEQLRNKRLSDAEDKGELLVEAVHYTKDNRRIIVESRVLPVKDQNGEITGYTAVNLDITERKKSQEVLMHTKEQYDLIFNSIEEGFAHYKAVYNSSGKLIDLLVLEINPAGAALTGVDRDEQIGKRWKETWPEIEDSLFESYEQVDRSGKSFRFEHFSPITNKWYITNISRTLPGQFAVTFFDITERKIAEESFLKSEERFRVAQELSPDGFLIFRPLRENTGDVTDFLWIYENDAAARMNDTNPKDVCGKRVSEVLPHHEQSPFHKAYKEVAETGEVRIIEEAFYDQDTFRQQRWFRVAAVPTAGGDVAILVQDVTERKKAEEARRVSESRLIEAQKLAHVGSFTYYIHTDQIEWSEEMFNIYGIDPEKGVPSYKEAISFIHPDDLGTIMSVLKKATENMEEILNLEYRIIRKDGQVRFLHYIGKPSFDDQGRQIKRFGTVMDITEEKLQEMELRETLEELKRSNKDLEQFAYVASHDLQEPIRMVSTYTKLIEREFRDKLDEKTSQYMFFVTDGAKRMHTLVMDLLAYSRVASRNEPFTRTDLNGIIAEVMRDLQVAISDYNAEILIDNLPCVQANASQIKLVFQNLIQNSIKFRGKDSPVVRINANKKAGEWILSVKDNGIGIDKEFFERIFVIFQRLHEKEKYPGSGIGLSICKKIVERHGGKIWVESEVDKGSTFYFTLSDRS